MRAQNSSDKVTGEALPLCVKSQKAIKSMVGFQLNQLSFLTKKKKEEEEEEKDDDDEEQEGQEEEEQEGQEVEERRGEEKTNMKLEKGH